MCALPSGISVPHMFIVTFVVMLPIAVSTGDPMKGWEAGLTWVFVQSFVLMAGGFVGPYIRKITPRAALLGTLAGVSITFISMAPALQMFMTPVIGITCFCHYSSELVRRSKLRKNSCGSGRDCRWLAYRLGIDRNWFHLRRHVRFGPRRLSNQLRFSCSCSGVLACL